MQSVMWLRSHLKQGIFSQKMTGSLNSLCVIVSMGITASSGPTMVLSIYLVYVDCLRIGKTWNACVFEIERPAGEGRDRIRGAQRRGFYGAPTPRRLSSRRRSHSTSYLFRKWVGLQLT